MKVLNKDTKKALFQLVLDAVKASDATAQDRVDAWTQAEKHIQSYAPKADAERKGNASQEKDGFVPLNIPYSYALLMAQHTYLSSVFLGKSPIFQFVGKTGQGQDSVMEAETIVEHQVINGEIATALYIALYDLLVYGVTIAFQSWEERYTYLTVYEEQAVQVEGVEVQTEGEPEMEEIETVQKIPGYKGSTLINVKPKESIVDPSVGYLNYQKGQFMGRRFQMPVQELQDKEALGLYFDTDNIKASSGKDGDLDGDNPALHNTAEPGEATSMDQKKMKGYVNMIELYIKLIPASCGLGKNTQQEIWVLTIADKRRLVGAVPAGWAHGEFPGFIGTAEYDGYTFSSRGTPEIAQPLNDTMNWLINTHMYNVEKSVNNEYLYDPSMINMRDFLDPNPGKRIRIRPEAYGKDVRTFMHQFQQYDYTQKNLQDIQFVEQLFQRVFGVNEQMLGALSMGGRKTATEIRSSAGFALNRLKVQSEFLGKHFFFPMGKKLLSASRQMYTIEDKFMITKVEDSAEMREFTPAEIVGEFDVDSVDGSIPIDRMAQANVLREVLQGVASLPAIAGRYDVAKFFEYIVKMLGVKNMDSFKITDQSQIVQESALGVQATGGNNGSTNAGTDSRGTGIGAQRVEGTPGQ